MRRLSRCILALFLLAGLAPTAAAYTEPLLESYTRESPNKAFIFVMLHAERPNPIGEKYPASGLYRNDGSVTPLWTFDDGYVREAYPASDGIHVVVQYIRVISLEQETCGDGVGNPEVFGFYASGKKIRDVKLGELLDHAAFCLEHGPGYHSWLKSARIDDEAGTLVVATAEGTHRTLALRTGHPLPFAGMGKETLESLFGPDRVPFPGSLGSSTGLVLGIVLALAVVAGTAAIGITLLRSRHPKP